MSFSVTTEEQKLALLEWARGIERDEPWLRKVLDDAKREYKKLPKWAKPSNDQALPRGGAQETPI